MSNSTRLAVGRIEASELVAAVPHLSAETLHQVICHIGIGDSIDYVAAATPQQIERVLDLDLWRAARPGLDAAFDVDRFGDWVEALVDHDPVVAARIVAGVDAHLVVVGLSRFIRVFDPGTFLPTAASDDEPMVASGSPEPSCALGGYTIRATRGDGWDAIVALLGELESSQTARFHEVMRGCRRLSDRGRELDGLDSLLETPDQWLHDVAARREARRTDLGYSTAADARAFLELARRRARELRTVGDDKNPVATAYFRDEATRTAPIEARGVAAAATIVDLLTEAGFVAERPQALLTGPSREAPRFVPIQPLMAFVRDQDPPAYEKRSHELAFLTNTLMAGCSLQRRPFTPQEASDAVVSTCNVGLEVLSASAVLPSNFLASHDLIAAFEVGWAELYKHVSCFVAKRLVAILGKLRIADAELLRDLHALRRRLRAELERGTPWLAEEVLDVLAILDTPAWMSVVGVLRECPVMPAALTAILQGATGAVSPTAFDFISTRRQIESVRTFVDRLPGLLSG